MKWKLTSNDPTTTNIVVVVVEKKRETKQAELNEWRCCSCWVPILPFAIPFPSPPSPFLPLIHSPAALGGGSVQRVDGENERAVDELSASSVQVPQTFHSHLAEFSSRSRWSFPSLQSHIRRYAPRWSPT